jgi:hypothetical protein
MEINAENWVAFLPEGIKRLGLLLQLSGTPKTVWPIQHINTIAQCLYTHQYAILGGAFYIHLKTDGAIIRSPLRWQCVESIDESSQEGWEQFCARSVTDMQSALSKAEPLLPNQTYGIVLVATELPNQTHLVRQVLDEYPYPKP